MSRKHKSKFLKAFGEAFEVFEALVDAVLAAGGSDEDIARIQSNGDLLRELVAVVMKYACKQNWIDPDLMEPRWPLEPVAVDEGEWEVVEHHFDKKVSLKDGIAALKKLAKKGDVRLLAGLRRAMEWIAAHPNAQLDHPIILPLARMDSDGYLVVPIFNRIWGYTHRRDLSLSRLDDVAYPHFAWLVLRKRTTSVAR